MGWLDALLRFDTNLFLQLNGMHTPWWDTAMLFVTRKETWIPLYLMLIIVLFREYRGKAWLILFFILVGFVACDQLSGLIKELVQRFRPGHDPAIQNLTHIVLKKGGDYSFVSSHASNTFYLFSFTWILFRNKTAFVTFLAWALLVSWSRIYVGAHFPLDLIGGWIVGAILAYLTFQLLMVVETGLFYGRHPRIEKTRLGRVNAGILVVTATTVFLTLLIAVQILHKYQLLV